MRVPELLAPAGSIETFLAAMDAGADACYLGLGDFNARKRAKNFTPHDLVLASSYAHSRGKKIYITLNTLVYDREIPSLLDVLDQIADAGVNGIIVQDWGVLTLVRKYYPDIPIHASTQMFCHNSLHAALLAEHGVTRIILPRELSIKEISTIMDRVPLEYEVFVHGSLCFSFSGCCLASSRMYGDSGNRGRCRQVCRFAAGSGTRKEYPFSMRDLDARPFAHELVRLGVSALKIEGRLKPASYVRDTVAAWRSLLDAIKDGTSTPTIEKIASSMRETCTGYFPDSDYSRLVNVSGRGTTGEILGTIRTISGPDIHIGKLRVIPVRGMKLRIQDAQGRNIYEGVLLEFQTKKRNTGTGIVWHIPSSIGTTGYTQPFTVFVTGESAPRDARKAMLAAFRAPDRPAIGINISLSADLITITATPGLDHPSFTWTSASSASPARSHPVSDEDMVRVFSETDRYPFRADPVTCMIEDGLFIPHSELKRIRRDFYRDFAAWRDKIHAENISKRRNAILSHLARIHESSGSATTYVSMVYKRDNGRFLSNESSPVMYPVYLDDTHGLPLPAHGVVLVPPLFVPEGAVEKWKKRIINLAGRGYRRFIAPSYGWIALSGIVPDIEWIAGPYYYTVNSFAVDALRESSIGLFVVSPDIPDSDIDPVSRYEGRLKEMNIPREMFVTRLDLPGDTYIIQGVELHVVHCQDYSVIQEHDTANNKWR